MTLSSPFNKSTYLLGRAASNLQKRMEDLERADTAIYEVKTTTGDPTARGNYHFVINTFDNTFKVYADGAWRTLDSW